MKFLLIVCTLAMAVLSLAQAGGVDPTKGLYFNQKLGTQIPMDVEFRDETGKTVRIGDYFKERPVILAFVFYDCKSSCLLIREGLIKTLNSQRAIKVNEDVDVVVVSIDHQESPKQAADMKAFYMERYRQTGTDAGWHFLTGSKDSIERLTEAVGFGFNYEMVKDPATGDSVPNISHPSGIILLTSEGKASLYMLGATYPAKVLHDGIERAKEHEIGPKTETILLGCIMIDPRTGQYRVVVEQVLKVAGISTMLILFGSIYIMAIKNRRKPLYKDSLSGGATP